MSDVYPINEEYIYSSGDEEIVQTPSPMEQAPLDEEPSPIIEEYIYLSGDEETFDPVDGEAPIPSHENLESNIIVNDVNENEIHPEGFEHITNILKSCQPDLSQYLRRCKEAFLINAAIPELTRDSVSKLFEKEIGLQGIFYKSLRKFRDSNSGMLNIDVIKEDNDIDKHRSPPPGYKSFESWKKIVSSLYFTILETNISCFKMNSQ